jgi:hypothetical protein
MPPGIRDARSLIVLVVLAFTLSSGTTARADRTEAKMITLAPIPLETKHVICVLKVSTLMEVPTSFSEKPAKEVKAWISTSTKGNSNIDHETFDITIQPKKTHEGEKYQYTVEGGRVEATHLTPTAEGIRSHQDTYQNANGERALSFLGDSRGHLALSGNDETLNLDFGTGILFRVWTVGPNRSSVFSEAYACKPTPF